MLIYGFMGSTDAGKRIMDYLRSITLNQVGGPEITNDKLRHLEGQRFLVGLIDARINAGRNKAKAMEA